MAPAKTTPNCSVAEAILMEKCVSGKRLLKVRTNGVFPCCVGRKPDGITCWEVFCCPESDIPAGLKSRITKPLFVPNSKKGGEGPTLLPPLFECHLKMTIRSLTETFEMELTCTVADRQVTERGNHAVPGVNSSRNTARSMSARSIATQPRAER